MGINTNVGENRTQLSQLLRKLTTLYKNSKEELSFTYLNSKPEFLVPIPNAKNFTTFEKNERREKWIESCFAFINSDNVEKACYWMLKCIYKKYPQIFVKLARDVGIHIVNEMSSVEVAAMWVESNVSYWSARIILRHLYAKFNFQVQVPFSQISILSDTSSYLRPNFATFDFKKKGEEHKTGKKVQYWTIPPNQFIESNFSRLLLCHPEYHNVTFQYKLPQNNRVNCLIGADHRAGKSRYLVWLNYLQSSARC